MLWHFICNPSILTETLNRTPHRSDLYMGKHVEVWYMDLVCDIWMLGDIGMKLITVVPKNTFPDQPAAANTIKSIAQLYFRHQFLGSV